MSFLTIVSASFVIFIMTFCGEYVIEILIMQAPTIAAAAYLRMAGRPPVLPSGNLSYSENFLYMLDSLYDIFSTFPNHFSILD